MELADTEPGENSYNPLIIEGEGYKITITAMLDGAMAYPYLDETNNRGPGGLGVCPIETDQCGDDDNMTVGESLMFTFEVDDGYTVTLNQIWFNNNHDDGFDDTDAITLDFSGVGGMSGEFNPVKDGTVVEGIKGTYAFIADPGKYMFGNGSYFGVSYFNEKLYVSAIALDVTGPPTEVPEPSNLVLMALGLMGLAIRRRQN
ncbi:PEP-CTERM sorting domain-containing protein [Thalassotalea sp. Y01]|uniref:PEP-CTERM sorting domain-containing protein n=1 Tax=Thalassotalea sp. Y01 TaxID=2729613 RepID=UPI00145C7373|nr:PEP-CTERM sorting domain-containing protein [Thalassotalea sp. Y01]NMP14829.1 PEP-CTERM sorting domain-containing protein [Thalassotalea sp. Y01]